MANDEYLNILRQGASVWNAWRAINKEAYIDFREANLYSVNLSGTDLHGAELVRANLYTANLSNTDLSEANLIGANLERADLRGANLNDAYLNDANLEWADLSDATLNRAKLNGAKLDIAKLIHTDLTGAEMIRTSLINADLSGANLSGTHLRVAQLHRANLSKAILHGADFYWASLVEANLSYADFTGARIYGISAWGLNTTGTIQSDLIVTPYDEAIITVDNLEVAQFIYLLLHNGKLRQIIDTLTTKSVLILGRFTEDRKAVLDAIREELRRLGYIPILFDFEKPKNRDLTETVMTLASLSRFVIADLSDPNSIPHELMSFVDKLLSVPVQGIFCPVEEHPNPYPMYEHLRRLPHVLPIYRYETAKELIASLEEKVIEPAEEKVKVVRPITLS